MRADQKNTGRRRSAGFTLIELMVVISLIVVLATLGLVQYRYSVVRSREAVLKEDLFRLRDAIDQYYADKDRYPEDLQALVTDGYLRQIPVDPFTNTAATWEVVEAGTPATSPFESSGISDVKSGSDAIALDGTAYADW